MIKSKYKRIKNDTKRLKSISSNNDSMKKIILFLFFPFFSFSQSYIGLHADNYKGIHGVFFNPSSIVNSPYKVDISILGVSIVADNDIYNLGFDTDFENFSLSNFSNDSNVFLNNDISGLGFMTNINKNNSIALYSRVRFLANGNDIIGEVFDSFFDGFSDNGDFDINDEDGFHIVGHSWGEIGLSYATILLNKTNHKLAAGATLKYLRGIGSASVNSNDLRVAYDTSSNTANLQGEINYYSTFDVDDFQISDQSGFGLDLGLTYEWKPDNDLNSENDSLVINDYKLKIGLSVMDIGHIKYSMYENRQYIANAIDVDESIFDNENLPEVFEQLYANIDLDNNLRVKLPTSLNVQADWNINSKFYVNMFSNLSLVSNGNRRTNNMVDNYILTPRFETKVFTAQLPLSYSGLGNFKAGIGFRLGPFYVGSGSVLSNLFHNDSKSADAYIGMKIPIYK